MSKYCQIALMTSLLQVYNQFFEGKSGEVRSREVNGRLILEGSLRIYWGVQGVIHLKEDDDQRTVVTVRKRNSYRHSVSSDDSDDDVQNISRDTSFNDLSTCSDVTISLDVSSDMSKSDTSIESGVESGETTAENSPTSPHPDLPKSLTLPSKLDVKNLEWDELDELLQVERKVDEGGKLYRTMPIPLPSQSSIESSSTISNESSSKTESCSNLTKTPVETSNGSALDDDLSPLRESLKDEGWLANSNHLNRSMSGPDCLGRVRNSPEFDRCSVNSFDISEAMTDVVIRRPVKTGSTAIRRRTGKRLSRSKVKRRCSINGHFYDRETSFFTPPHGCQTSVWVTSLVNTQEVINLMLEKYKVDSDGSNFALFVIRDNGGEYRNSNSYRYCYFFVFFLSEQRRLKDDEYPLLARVLLGPHEDVAKLFLMDSHSTSEVSSEVAQFLNLSLAECRAILNQYYSQEEREVARLREKYQELKRRMLYRMDELKASL